MVLLLSLLLVDFQSTVSLKMVKTKRQAKSWTEEYKDFDEKKKKVKGENEKEVEKHLKYCCDL